MTEKIYIATDLGPGDGGKGGIVHWLANAMKAHTVIKRGGAQGAHGVRNSRGESFSFSQWGCGTLEGIPTFISDQLIMMPVGLSNEAEALEKTFGIHNAFSLLSVDPNCICATPYHRFASHIKELALKDNPRGTVGTGVGQAYRYADKYPSLTIRAADLANSNLRDRLADIRTQVIQDLAPYLEQHFLPADQDTLQNDLAYLSDDGFLDYTADLFRTVGKKLRFAHLSDIIRKQGVAVIECSHGVLTDAEQGLKPHTSAIRTLPEFSVKMLRDAGFTGKIVNLGIHRAYEIRHGAGPIPTADPSMNHLMPPGSHKETNRWQGEVRVGPLDIPLLKHALDICGGASCFDGLCITWFDQILKDNSWKICSNYQADTAMTTEALAQAVPVYCTHQLPKFATREAIFDWCQATLSQYVSTPVRLLSIGATESDKICK